MFKQGDKVRRKNIDLKAEEGIMDQNTIQILKDCNFTGEVSQVQEGLFYVGFKSKNGWVTQVFKEEELEAVK